MKTKLFGTDGIRGEWGKEPMTRDTLTAVAKAAAKYFAKPGKKTELLIGKDTRESSDEIEKLISKALSEQGVDVHLVGYIPTPAVAFLTKEFGCAGGLVISASHNPHHDNGVKFFDTDGYKLADKEEKAFEKLVEDKKVQGRTSKRKGDVKRHKKAAQLYEEKLHSTIDCDLNGLRIVLDCAHGAASEIGPGVFQKLGAEVITLNNTPDGRNINLNCGSMHPQCVAEHVRMYEADMGVALDGDADRVILIDENGEELCGDTIMAIVANHKLQNKSLNKDTLIITQYSNSGLKRMIERNNGKVVEVKNGDKYVAQEMRKRKVNFGGEQSGHLIFHDHSTTGDGLLSACQVLNIMQEKKRKLSELSMVLRKTPQKLVNVDVREKTPFAKLKNVQSIVQDAQDNLGAMGRVVLRYSGTQNQARVMVEGIDPDEVEMYAMKIAEALTAEVGAYPF